MNKKIIPITDFVRKFGAYADLLPFIDELILTREGRPFATLKATPEEKNAKLLTYYGSWENTPLYNYIFWVKALIRKNRDRKALRL